MHVDDLPAVGRVGVERRRLWDRCLVDIAKMASSGGSEFIHADPGWHETCETGGVRAKWFRVWWAYMVIIATWRWRGAHEW
jgi:hypothetical protein